MLCHRCAAWRASALSPTGHRGHGAGTGRGDRDPTNLRFVEKNLPFSERLSRCAIACWRLGRTGASGVGGRRVPDARGGTARRRVAAGETAKTVYSLCAQQNCGGGSYCEPKGRNRPTITPIWSLTGTIVHRDGRDYRDPPLGRIFQRNFRNFQHMAIRGKRRAGVWW